MASPEDLRQPAATIAAALIARVDPEWQVTPEAAAKLYYEVLDAMREGLGGDYDDPMPFSAG